MNTLRCSICDRTNNMHLANNPGGYTGSHRRYFFPDPKNPKVDVICLKCKEEIDDAKREYFTDVE